MKRTIYITAIIAFILLLILILPNIDNSPDIINSNIVKLDNNIECLRSKNLLVQYVKEDTIWASRNLTIYKSINAGKSFQKQFTFKPSVFSKLYIKNNNLFKKIFGFKVSLKILTVSPIILDIDWRVYLSNDEGRSFKEVNRGVSPLGQGTVMDKSGNIYYGEYTNQGPSRLFFSSDKGQTWQVLYTFNNIRHIHSVRYDKYEDKIWVTTGDRDKQCFIGYLEKIGDSTEFYPIAHGKQWYRAVSLLFDSNYVYWGMDSPNRQNFIFRYNRSTKEIENLIKINGPAYYSMKLNNGLMIIATTLEGEKGDWDNKASLWTSKNGTDWKRNISFAKIPATRKKVILEFPCCKSSNDLVITPTYTEKYNFDILTIKLAN